MISYCFNKKLFQVYQVCWDPLSQHAQVHHHTSGNCNFINTIEFFYNLTSTNSFKSEHFEVDKDKDKDKILHPR